MRIIFTTSFAALFALSLVSCETTPSPGTSDVAVAEAGAVTIKPYPLDTCLVTGEGIESKGTPFTLVHEGQEVKVCCVACKIAFKSSPGPYLAKLP